MFNSNSNCPRATRLGAKSNAEAESRRYLIMARLFVLALLILLVPSGVYSQILYGSLTGTATDQKGAVVPGVKVEVKNVATGVSNEAVTDGGGSYQFSDLQPGLYNVTFTLASFKTLIQENVRIDSNAARRVNAQMQVADVKETVVVTQDVAPLQTERTDVNTQLQASQITDLPITSSAGRNYQSLYKIVPGFSAVTEGVSSDGGNPQRSMTGNVNGNSMQANVTRIDGA